MNKKNPQPTETFSNIPTTNYENLLRRFGIKQYSQIFYYLKVGNADQSEGWIFHISVRLVDFDQLAQKLIPYLIQYNLSFMLPINSDIHAMILNCHLGYINLGKVFIIFPNKTSNLSKLADELIEISAYFKGPAIPTDVPLGNQLYTKYGSYESFEPKYIVNPNGIKIIDLETVPFKKLPWVSWPFKYPLKTILIQKGAIINGKYYVREILKPDAKGFVIKALFQKNLFTYKNCLIKEGRMGMAEDLHGREIGDRLIWQMHVHEKLQDLLPIPRVLTFFQENSNSYLVLSYISGISLGNLLYKFCGGNHWNNINQQSKVYIIDTLLKSICIIKNLHKENFIHRDLNSENFLIDKKGKVWLIDMELTYDLSIDYPNPPFEKGTEGYMSPEQELSATPTFEQDIYSIGSLMVKCFIQFDPSKFDLTNINGLKNKFSFFCNDAPLVDLIIACLEIEINKRPSLDKIIISLEEFKTRTIKNNYLGKTNRIDPQILGETISYSINTLTNNIAMSSEGIWNFPNPNNDNFVGNARYDRTINVGLENGISGVLYLMAKAKLIGFNTDLISGTITKNFTFLEEYFLNNKNEIPSGLYSGKSGIALSISSLIKANIIPNTEKNIQIMYDCFTNIPSTMEIEHGMAGYGLSLLKCYNQLDKNFTTKNANYCIDYIMNKQLPNGSWTLNSVLSKNEILPGFNEGISGIIWFLINYINYYPDNLIINKIHLALDFLIKSSKSYKGYKTWKISSKSNEIYDFNNGGFNILRPFIRAYIMNKEERYKEIVEQILYSYPIHITTDLFSQESGIAGLGEIYIEAWQTFKNEEWLIRAEWIAQVLVNTTYGEFHNSYWRQGNSNYLNASLFKGNSGIIHFLLRIFSPNQISSYFSCY